MNFPDAVWISARTSSNPHHCSSDREASQQLVNHLPPDRMTKAANDILLAAFFMGETDLGSVLAPARPFP